MLICISLMLTMLFNVLRKFFGWVDESSRKRRASDIDADLVVDYVAAKKHCHNHNFNNINNHREVVEIEDDNDCMEIYEDGIYMQTHVNKRHLNNINNSIKRLNRNPTNFSTPKNLKSKFKTFKMGSNSGKSCLNSHQVIDGRCSTLSKINQLREKEEYSRMLTSMVGPRIQIIQPTPRTHVRRSQKPIEVIDIDSCENSELNKCTTDIYSTPKMKTPIRWFTPSTGPSLTSTARRGKQHIEEIRLDDERGTVNFTSPQSEKSTEKPNKFVLNRSSEVAATNTLRDKLSAKEVMKLDYIPRVSERYNERMVQRYKEAEELKKMTTVLAKHNRLQREAALEVQLARSMRLCEAVLEEADELEEPSLPELTTEMIDIVHNALIPHPAGQILIEKFGLRVTRKDIHTLAGLNWLNDEVINFYMNLLIDRGNHDKFPNVHAMNTFFYPKLLSGGHSSLKRWTRKIDIFAKDLVIVPIHLGVHWCMSVIDFRDKSIRYYDSMGGQNQKCLNALRKYLEDESLDKKKQSYDTSGWTLENMRDIPQQMNGSDCGVFSCTFAEFISANRKITFSQDDMPYFRDKMVYEILKVKIL